jgi:hypothetical protein
MKHGRRSGQMQRAVDKIMSDDDIRAVVRLFGVLSDAAAKEHYQESLERFAARAIRKRKAARAQRRRSPNRRTPLPNSPPEPYDPPNA